MSSQVFLSAFLTWLHAGCALPPGRTSARGSVRSHATFSAVEAAHGAVCEEWLAPMRVGMVVQ